MQHARLASLFVVTLLQLCKAQSTPETWYAANVISDELNSLKPLSEIFSTESTFSSTNPIVVLSMSSQSPTISTSTRGTPSVTTSTQTPSTVTTSQPSIFSASADFSIPTFFLDSAVLFQSPQTTPPPPLRQTQSTSPILPPQIQVQQTIPPAPPRSPQIQLQQTIPTAPAMPQQIQVQQSVPTSPPISPQIQVQQTIPTAPPLPQQVQVQQTVPTAPPVPQQVQFQQSVPTSPPISSQIQVQQTIPTAPPVPQQVQIQQTVPTAPPVPQQVQVQQSVSTSPPISPQIQVQQTVPTSPPLSPQIQVQQTTPSPLPPQTLSTSRPQSTLQVSQSTPQLPLPPPVPPQIQFQQPPTPPSPPPILGLPQQGQVQTGSQVPQLQGQPPNYFLMYQQAPQTVQNPPNQSQLSPLSPVSTTNPPCATNVPITSLQGNTLPPSYRIRMVVPSGTVTNLRINDNPAIVMTTGRITTTRKPRRNRNTFDGCVNGCSGPRSPICATPADVTPIDPDDLKGFPSACHMACHNSFRRTLYEKVADGKCSRLRNRIRTIDSIKLNRDELNKASYTIVQNQPSVVEFSPLTS